VEFVGVEIGVPIDNACRR